MGCRRKRPKGELFRLTVAGSPPRVTLDATGTLPGRGAYLCRESAPACWRLAGRRRAVSRSLRLGHDVIEDPALAQRLERLHEELNPSPRSRS